MLGVTQVRHCPGVMCHPIDAVIATKEFKPPLKRTPVKDIFAFGRHLLIKIFFLQDGASFSKTPELSLAVFYHIFLNFAGGILSPN